MSQPITPIPLPEGARRPLLFGGTFDPVTRAHAELGLGAMRARGFDALVFVPAARSPHKDTGPIASEGDRVEMLRRATLDEPCATVWTDELDRAGAGEPSYWVQTIRRAQEWGAQAGVGTGAFLVGADQAVAFDRWREARWLFEHAEPLVMLRQPSASVDEIVAAIEATGAWSEDDLAVWRSRVVELPLCEASATSVRDAIATVDSRALDRLLDPRVRAYVESKMLYR